jgi:condensin complex subunit 2
MADPTAMTATGATAARQRKEKLPFVIDFEGPSTITTKKLFEPGTKTATSLPAPKIKKRKVTKSTKRGKKVKQEEEVEERDEHLLPDDMHFSSRQLLRLFLKPKFTVSLRLSWSCVCVSGKSELDWFSLVPAQDEASRSSRQTIATG